MNNLNHFNTCGEAYMVNIGPKQASNRKASASGKILMHKKTLEIAKSGDSKKGDIIGVARIAAIQGCKKTSELIPLCHQINITSVDIKFNNCYNSGGWNRSKYFQFLFKNWKSSYKVKSY